jgi:hypothetical protein
LPDSHIRRRPIFLLRLWSFLAICKNIAAQVFIPPCLLINSLTVSSLPFRALTTRKTYLSYVAGTSKYIQDIHPEASKPPLPRYCTHRGNAAASTSCAMRSPMLARAGGAWSRPSSQPPSPRRTPRPPGSSGAGLPISCVPRCPSSRSEGSPSIVLIHICDLSSGAWRRLLVLDTCCLGRIRWLRKLSGLSEWPGRRNTFGN